MNLAAIDSYLSTNGLALAQYVYDNGAGFGFSTAQLRSYRAVGQSYFGPCPEKRTRAKVMKLAEDFPIARLVVIHKAAGRLSKGARLSRWEFRLELAQRTDLSLAELEEYATARTRQLGAKRGPRSMIIGRSTDVTGRRTAVVKLPEAEMAQLESQIRQMIIGRRVPEDIAMGNALWTLINSGVTISARNIEPTVLVSTDDLEGKGPDTLQATDGTEVDAAEYLNGRLSNYGWVILYDKNAQPVNLWRTKRHANDKQRMIIAADQGQCAWPGCKRLALYGKAHHVHPWSQGGNTNIDNLMGLCGPHNALNDDDPEIHRNGRMARDAKGRAAWYPPDGGPPQNNRGQHTLRSGREWAVT